MTKIPTIQDVEISARHHGRDRLESAKKTAPHPLTIAESRVAGNFLNWQAASLKHEPGGLRRPSVTAEVAGPFSLRGAVASPQNHICGKSRLQRRPFDAALAIELLLPIQL
jgi:hypothetical protein